MFPRIRWPLVAVTFLAALAVFYFGYTWRLERQTYNPLEEALHERPFVEEVEIDREAGLTQINLTLKPSADWKQAAVEIEESVAGIVGDDPYTLVLEDKRDEKLENFYEQAHIYAYEAARLGSYREAAEMVGRTARAEGINSYQFQVDEENVYLYAQNGEHFLCEIIEIQFPE